MNNFNTLNEQITNSLNKTNCIKYALNAAKLANTGTKEEIECIEAVEAYLENPNEKNIERCRKAANAAYAAYHAATNAAYAAAYSAYAARAAERNPSLAIPILQYGCSLLKEENKTIPIELQELIKNKAIKDKINELLD